MSQDLVKDHFQKMGQDGSYAAFYGDRGPATHDFFTRRDRVQDFLVSHTKPGQVVLDVGCGTGPMVEFCCSRGLRYCGVDVAQSMLDSISQQFKSTPYWKDIELKVGSSENVPYGDGTFDILIGMGLLEYFPDMQPTFREIGRVVKPGGLAAVTIPNRLSLNRFIMRNTGFITTMYRLLKKSAGAAPGASIWHKELTPGALDESMKRVGFERVGRAFYDYKLVCYPLSRMFPAFAYGINRRIENKAPGFLANGYIGFYRKQS